MFVCLGVCWFVIYLIIGWGDQVPSLGIGVPKDMPLMAVGISIQKDSRQTSTSCPRRPKNNNQDQISPSQSLFSNQYVQDEWDSVCKAIKSIAGGVYYALHICNTYNTALSMFKDLAQQPLDLYGPGSPWTSKAHWPWEVFQPWDLWRPGEVGVLLELLDIHLAAHHPGSGTGMQCCSTANPGGIYLHKSCSLKFKCPHKNDDISRTVKDRDLKL